MDWFLEPFEPAFMQRALAAGLLAVLASATVGTWVVLRGLTFLGDALAHGVLPGMALAVVWGFDIGLGAAASAAVMVGGITVVSRRARLGDDVGIGLLFVGMLALGVIIVSRSQSFTTDLQGLLFGDVLGVTTSEIETQRILVAVVVVACVVGYRPFLALAFNQQKAAALGLRPTLSHFALLALITLAILSSFRAVGALLVFGLIVGPPATAALLVRRVWLAMLVAVGIGWVSVALGLVISFQWGTAAGATMAGVSVAAFFVVLSAQEAIAAIRRFRSRWAPTSA
jgi:ABC-type Mn2+/Zn2+ transport system permease subunit